MTHFKLSFPCNGSFFYDSKIIWIRWIERILLSRDQNIFTLIYCRLFVDVCFSRTQSRLPYVIFLLEEHH